MVCKKCSNSLAEGSLFCNVCGARQDGMRECPRCRNIIEEGSTFCKFCGKRLVKSDIKLKIPADTKTQGLIYRIFTLLFALLIFAASLGTVFVLKLEVPNADVTMKLRHSPFDFAEASLLIFDKDYNYADFQSYMDEVMSENLDSQTYYNYKTNNSNISLADREKIYRAFEKINLLKIYFTQEYIEENPDHTAIIMLYTVSLIGISVLALVFAVISACALLQKKDLKSSGKFYTALFCCGIVFLFLLRPMLKGFSLESQGVTPMNADMDDFAGGGIILLLVLSALAFIIKQLYCHYIQKGNTLPLKSLVKRVVVSLGALLFMAVISGNVINYTLTSSDNTKYKAHSDALSFTRLIVNLFDENFAVVPVQEGFSEYKAIIDSSATPSQKREILKLINLNDLLMTNDMDLNYPYVPILDMLLPLILMALYGASIAIIAKQLSEIDNGKETYNKNIILSVLTIVFSAYVVAIASLTSFFFNDSLLYEGVENISASLAAAPVIALVISAALLIFKFVFVKKEKAIKNNLVPDYFKK